MMNEHLVGVAARLGAAPLLANVDGENEEALFEMLDQRDENAFENEWLRCLHEIEQSKASAPANDEERALVTETQKAVF